MDIVTNTKMRFRKEQWKQIVLDREASGWYLAKILCCTFLKATVFLFRCKWSSRPASRAVISGQAGP